jgi:hypothetical protein
MKSRSRFVAVSVLLTSTLISIPYSSAAGRSTSAVVNTILNGKGAPKSSLGIDGDFYIDTRSLLLYGPKTKGKWPTPQSIQGPTGPAGSDGRNGNDGKAVATNVSAVTGAQGPVGPQGEKGEKGDPGAPGAMGPAGPAGASGSMGPAGPSGANGSNGAQGPAGPTGATGAAGAQGPKGETGTVGPSEVTVIDIPSWTLGSGTPLSYSASQLFGVLQSNKSYQFVLHVTGTSSFSSFVLGVDLVSTGNALNFSYSRNNIRYASYSTVSNVYTFEIYGTIQIGSADSSLQIRVIDGFGDSGSNPLTLTGKAYITLLGAIK